MRLILIGLIAVVLGVVWAAGVGHGQESTPISVYVADEAVLYAATEDAIAVWREETGAEQFRLTTGIADITVRWSDTLDVAAGWYPSGLIEVSTSWRPGIDCLRCAVVHELGHALGIPHGAGGLYGLVE